MNSISAKLKFLVFAIVILIIASPMVVFAKSSQEISNEIEDQKKSLEQSKKELENAKVSLNSSSAALENVSAGLPALEAQIAKIEAELNYNEQELVVLNENKKLKELEKIERELEREESLKSTYMEWRLKDSDIYQLVDTTYDFKKSKTYSELVMNSQQAKILGLTTDLEELATDISDFESAKIDLQKVNEELATAKRKLEDEIAAYRNAIAYNNSRVNSLNQNINQIQQNLTQLSAEQKSALERELQLLNSTNPLGGSVSGCNITNNAAVQSFTFCGLGRDLYQGHGVGLSQWGAHGMGNIGFTANDIVSFYYQNTAVAGGYEGRVINVQGYGAKNVEDYVAGQGEVPAKACGNQDQVASNPSKYVVDNPSTNWDCWPEEAIKAQIIAFRTYALFYTRNGATICTTAACQVYNGTQNTRWAADETRGLVVTQGGNVIEAVYSADNNQGFGTANNDTIWQNYVGNGSLYSYLRSVNDNQWATKTSWTTWGYKTLSYSPGSMNDLLDFVASSGVFGGYSGLVAEANAIKSSLNGVTSVEFERDPSLRVKKVWFVGTNGQRKALGGYWFKFIWNEWAASKGINDFIYSQTFFVN